jgi:hypothetical protein
MKATDVQRAFEKFMRHCQDPESVDLGMQHNLGNKTVNFSFSAPDPDAISPVIVDNGDGTHTALVTIQVNISNKIQDEDEE